MKKTILTAIIASMTLATSYAGGEGWTSDFEAATKKALAEDKSLFLEFTGSDWCSPCIALKKKILSKDAFINGVKNQLVLVELDYPDDTSKLSKATIEQNKKLLRRYRIDAYPTIFLTDAQGRPFAATGGYLSQTPKQYADHINSLLIKKKERDAGLAAAAKLEGAAKANALIKTLEAMDLGNKAMLVDFYGDSFEQIKKADPKDESGFVARIESEFAFAKFVTELMELDDKGDLEAALKFAKKAAASGNFKGEHSLDIAYMISSYYVDLNQYQEAIAVMEEAKKKSPDAETTEYLDEYIKEIRGKMKGAAPNDSDSN